MSVGFVSTAGECVSIESSLPWVMRLLDESVAGAVQAAASRPPTLRVRIDAADDPFSTNGWELLTRHAWRNNGEVVIENACTSGFDVHVGYHEDAWTFTFRWRPPMRDRVAARLLRARFHLLARATLMQYPALWVAGTRGRAPLHASGLVMGRVTALVSAASGVGRSTVVLRELADGGQATGDNIAVTDGTSVWGLVEPIRIEGGSGRRMPHGRTERPLDRRVEAVSPDRVVILDRSSSDSAHLLPLTSDAAARALVTATYMAGELRRYWPFAATLSAATGAGPAHPPIVDVAAAVATRLPCVSIALGRARGERLSDLLDAVEEVAA